MHVFVLDEEEEAYCQINTGDPGSIRSKIVEKHLYSTHLQKFGDIGYGEAYLSHEGSKSEDNIILQFILSMTPNKDPNDGYQIMDQDGECDGMRY